MDKLTLTNAIIDNIEGGYYHPDMKSNLRNGDRLGDSGETMFGIDRRAGAPQFTTKTADAVAFWNLVDQYYGTHHSDATYYGDKADGRRVPANVGIQLRHYVSEMIEDAYDDWNDYLSDGAKRIVENDPRLMLQFWYAVWNGPGNFQKFANLVNAAYSNGERSALAFWNLIQNARRSRGGLFAEGADKLDAIAAGLPGSSNVVPWLLAIAAAGFIIYKIVK